LEGGVFLRESFTGKKGCGGQPGKKKKRHDICSDEGERKR